MITENLKNIPGWSSKERLVAFAVDDYGNVRLHSPAAKQTLSRQFGPPSNRFDGFDALETREDLERLYEVLSSVSDREARTAVFSPYAVSMNLDFSLIDRTHDKVLPLEALSTTFQKLEADYPTEYAGVPSLWREGIRAGLLSPEYHGPVHFSTLRVEGWLKDGFPEFEAALAVQSVVLFGQRTKRSSGWTAAFADAPEGSANSRLAHEFSAGMQAFREHNQLEPTAFTPPAHVFPRHLLDIVKSNGLKFIDLPRMLPSEPGAARPWQRLMWSGRELAPGLRALTRNVVFEPCDGGGDSVGKAMRQIEASFRFRKPAIVSSHRVNFAGRIDPKNREHGLGALSDLLKAIIKRWPDVRFVSVRDLAGRIDRGAARGANV